MIRLIEAVVVLGLVAITIVTILAYFHTGNLINAYERDDQSVPAKVSAYHGTSKIMLVLEFLTTLLIKFDILAL